MPSPKRRAKRQTPTLDVSTAQHAQMVADRIDGRRRLADLGLAESPTPDEIAEWRRAYRIPDDYALPPAYVPTTEPLKGASQP
jgi:hypothetical protein